MAPRLGFLGGLVAFVATVALLPADGLPLEARWAAATAALMAVWWLTEALPPAATAMVPMVVLPLTGAMPAGDVTRAYASQTNMLFLGGLMIATAAERWDLHRRVALRIVDAFGRTPSGLVFGFMASTGLLSGWISNAATTMMMIPIAAAVLQHFGRDDPDLEREMAGPLLLAIAYSASIGGLATIVGTPPNAIFVGQYAQLFPDAPRIGFLQWMMVGVPVVVVMLPLVWLYLVRVASSLWTRSASLDRRVLAEQRAALGPMSAAERRVSVVFAITGLLWMTRSSIRTDAFTIPGWSTLLPEPGFVGDSTVAIGMALVLFLLPSGTKPGHRLLDWETATRLPWGVIVLLGGGFALADAMRATGLAQWIGSGLGGAAALGPLLTTALLCLAIVFLTEMMTNTALTTIMMPILAASAVASGIDPLALMVPCTLAASLAFMMPSGTAPNAIVFSTGHLTIAYMARVGFALNLISIVVVTAVVMLLAGPVFGISLDTLPAWAHP